MTIVISAFPGTGKTTLFNSAQDRGLNISDSDSSAFPKDSFPANYIEHIRNLIEADENDIILVSSHENVREALREAGIEYILVYPMFEVKEEYLERYAKRGSPEAFIKLLNDNWDAWVGSCEYDPGSKEHYVLGKGEYLSEIIECIL